MRDTVAELARLGSQLPPEDRERLVDALLASLNQPAVFQLDGEWAAEIDRRLAAYDRGEVRALDGEDVLARARALAR